MRVYNVQIHEGAHEKHPDCEWSGCREQGDVSSSRAEISTYWAEYEILTGRLHKSERAKRIMGLCFRHMSAFHEKYCKKCDE